MEALFKVSVGHSGNDNQNTFYVIAKDYKGAIQKAIKQEKECYTNANEKPPNVEITALIKMADTSGILVL